MPSLEEDLAAAGTTWDAAAPVIKTEMPETGLAIQAEKVFEEQITPISAIEKRRKELGVEDASLATRDQRDSLASVNGLCRTVNGQIERVRKFLVEDAVRTQKVVNALAKNAKEEVTRIQKPILDRIAEWKAEDEAAEQAALQAQRDAEEAERKAVQAIEDAKRAAEAKRLADENQALKVQREVDRLEREKLEAELTKHRAAQAAAAKAEADRLAADVAEKARQLAAEREQQRLEALRPDASKINAFGNIVGTVIKKAPKVANEEAERMVIWAIDHLTRIATELQQFGKPN